MNISKNGTTTQLTLRNVLILKLNTNLVLPFNQSIKFIPWILWIMARYWNFTPFCIFVEKWYIYIIIFKTCFFSQIEPPKNNNNISRTWLKVTNYFSFELGDYLCYFGQMYLTITSEFVIKRFNSSINSPQKIPYPSTMKMFITSRKMDANEQNLYKLNSTLLLYNI